MISVHENTPDDGVNPLVFLGVFVNRMNARGALSALVVGFALGIFRLAGGRLVPSDYWLRFGIAFIPIMAAAHIIKSLLKMTSRIPYWEYAFSDPLGVETARGILDKSVPLASLPYRQ